MRLKVCGAHEVGQFEAAGFSHMVSVGDWDDHFDGLRLPEIPEEGHLILKFTDTQHTSHSDAPTEEKIAPLFEWLGGQVVTGLLVHCAAGISRSPAVAVLSLCALFPEQDPYALMVKVGEAAECSCVWPNPLVVEIGDQILARDGEIVAGVDRWRSEQPDLLAQM